MKRIIYTLLIGTAAVTLTGCKKSVEEVPKTESRTKADDATARNELDKVNSDIEAVYNSEEYADASGLRTTGAILPCGKVTFSNKNFQIDYSKSGVNCGSRVLSGTIDVTLLTPGTFADPNAKLKIVYTDYKVLYYTNNQSITYNGTSYIINGPNGGTLLSLFKTTPDIVIHKVRGQLELTFDTTGTGSHNVIREWNVFRKNTYTSDGTPSGITLKVEGDTAIAVDSYIPGTFNETSEYGISRDGDQFVCNLSTPFFWANCGSAYEGPYILKEGKVEYTVDLRSNPVSAAGITKGTWSASAGYRQNASGAYVYDGSCDSDGYKLDFALKNSSGTSVYSSSSYQQY